MPEVKSYNYTDERNIIKILNDKGLTEAVDYIRALKNIIKMQNYNIEAAKEKINQLIKLDKEC